MRRGLWLNSNPLLKYTLSGGPINGQNQCVLLGRLTGFLQMVEKSFQEESILERRRNVFPIFFTISGVHVLLFVCATDSCWRDSRIFVFSRLTGWLTGVLLRRGILFCRG